MASNPYGYQSSHVSYANASVGMGYPSPYTAAPSAATYNPGPGFAFKKRFERVDWRKIAAADVDNISRGLDFNALQENVSNITFCNIESELDMRTIDPNFVKLFKLAQMTIEYLLHSQDYLSGVVMSLEEKLRTVMKEHEETKKALAKATNDLVEVKRESHKRKKLLMTQQQMIQTGANSYNKCPQCSKAFINASFLNAHITRRHPECINQLVPAIGQGAPPTPQPANGVLERQLLDIQQRLMQTEAQLVEERNARNARNAQNAVVMKGKNQKIMADQDTEDDLEMWKTEQLQQHKREMERLRETFMKELTEMNEKNSASEMAVQKLQRQLARQSGLGQLEDDDVADDNKQALKKQHHEITRLKEQMQQQVAKVEGAMSEKFREQEHKWQTKLYVMTQQHKEELEQAVNVSAVDMRRRRQGQGETSAGYKMKKQEHDQRPQQPETTQVMRMDQDKEEEQLRPAPRREVTTVTTMTYKTNGKKDSDSVEESSDEETDNAMEQTTGDATTTFGTMTMPTLGTETLSFRETKKTRLLDQMKHDPNFLENMKQQLRNVLDKELEKCGIPSGTERLSNSVYQSKLALLKNERQKKAKRCPTLYNIRQQHINMVEQQAKQEMKKRFGSPKPSAAGTPSRGWNSAPSTPQMKSDGTPARVPPVPAPRTASPNTMMGTASTFSSTARATPQPRARKTSSSQWDSEDDDEDDDDDDDDDEDEDAVDAIAAAQGASIFSQRSVANRTGNETISDNDEWDSSEPVSPEATNRHGQPPMLQYNTNSSSSTKVVLRQPRGQNVAALAKTIDHKLNMRSTTKKPAGAVNTVPGGQGQAGSSPTKGQQSSLDNDDFDDDLESVSSVEDCGSELPSPAKRSIQPQARRSIAADTSSSTNTYGTSAWGSSRAPSTAPQHPSRQSVSKSSVCSISDLDDDR